MFKNEESFCKIIKFRFNYTFSVGLGSAFWRAFCFYVQIFKTSIFFTFCNFFSKYKDTLAFLEEKKNKKLNK